MVKVKLVTSKGYTFGGPTLYRINNNVFIQFMLVFDSTDDAKLFTKHMTWPSKHIKKLFTLAVMEDCEHGLEKLIESLKDNMS